MTPLVSYKTVHSLYNYISITSDIVTGRYHPAIVAFVEGILGMSASRSISDILSQCRESGKESADVISNCACFGWVWDRTLSSSETRRSLVNLFQSNAYPGDWLTAIYGR